MCRGCVQPRNSTGGSGQSGSSGQRVGALALDRRIQIVLCRETAQEDPDSPDSSEIT